MPRLWCAVAALSTLSAACDLDGTIAPERLKPGSFEPRLEHAAVPLSIAPSFADERGGGIFIDPAGKPVRLRVDGTVGALEVHPSSDATVGAIAGAWPLGPYTALLSSAEGILVADQGWVIAPAWRQAFEGGTLDHVVVGEDTAWLAHSKGLFRLEDGQLHELKVSGASVTGITALTVGAAPDGSPGVWYAQGTTLFIAAQRSKGVFVVTAAPVETSELKGGVIGLAGLGNTTASIGEVWAITPSLMLRFSGTNTRRFTLEPTLRQLKGAGRSAWLTTADGLYSYDGETSSWQRANGVAASAELLAVDAAGTAWVQADDKTMSVARTLVPRAWGMHQGERLYEAEAVVKMALPSAVTPSALSYRLDEREPQTVAIAQGQRGQTPLNTTTFYSVAGLDGAEEPKPLSFSGLSDGTHRLLLSATVDGAELTQAVYFFFAASSAQVSWARDLKPLNDSRCASCHQTGTTPELRTFDDWKANASAIAEAVRTKRMPADGPMDAASISAVLRWANGGLNP